MAKNIQDLDNTVDASLRHQRLEQDAARIRLHAPDELRRLPVWVCFKLEARADKTGKFDKVPYYATTGRKRQGTQGTSGDRSQLVPLESALDAMVHDEYDGVGCAFVDDVECFGIDVDNARNARGEWKPLAKELLGLDTYAETSPSGNGFHLLLQGAVSRNDKYRDVGDDMGIELFGNKGFLTFTGNRINGSDLRRLDDDIVRRLDQLISSKSAASSSERANSTTDEELRALLRAGDDGKRTALLSLTARFVGRGMTANDVVASLEGLMDECAWKERNPKRWQTRRAGIRKLVADAVKKFGDKRQADTTIAHHPAQGLGALRVNRFGNYLCTLPDVAAGLQSILDKRKVTIYKSLFHNRLVVVEAGERRDLTDADMRSLWAAVQLIGKGFESVKKDLMFDAIAFVGDRFARDEVLDWLNGLKWDGVPRLDTLCADGFGVACTDYHVAVFKNLLVAAVGRQYQPGTKFDHVTTLISQDQGKFKTWVLEALFGTDYVACVPKDPTSRDSMLLMRSPRRWNSVAVSRVMIWSTR